MTTYLLTRTLDPIFALSIGATSAWLRIRREEVSRAVAAASTTNPEHSPVPLPAQDLKAGSMELTMIERGDVSRQGTVGERGSSVVVPTSKDTWELLKRRVWNIDVRKWDLRNIWRQRDSWGVVEPGQLGRRKE
jgi:hypothetical protein